MVALIFVTILATLILQGTLLFLLRLGDGINHPEFYLGVTGIGLLLWCFGESASRR